MQNEITELRNQVRTLRKIVYGFGCLLVAGIVVGATSLQTVPDVIQAKKFEVVNDEGVAVVTLDSFQESGVIHTTDSLGDKVFVVVAEKNLSGVSIGTVTTLNGKGQTLVRLSANTGGGTVTTENGKSQTLVQLGSNIDGEGAVTTENGKGQTLVRLSASPSGGMVTTENGKGQTLVQLAGLNGDGVILTANDKGEITSTTP